METFPATGGRLDTAGSSSTRPLSRHSSSTSRSSSATPSNSTRLTTPELPKTPTIARQRLLAELPKFPSHDGTSEAHEAIARKGKKTTARPGLTRYHTTEALRPLSHSTQSASRSTFFSPALATSSIVPHRSKPPIRSIPGSDLNHGYSYPPGGDGRKRAASLDDLRISSNAFSAESSIPTDLPFPLPTSLSISSPQGDSGTTNRSKSHGIRRWHTLMELASTEEGYVKDLKVLVRIYLQNLSLVAALEPEARNEIARNADALLTLHKKICRRLQRVVTEEQLKELGPNKGSVEAQRRVDKAASKVASIFIKEAASFHLYEAFCAGHSQALDLIRQVQGHPEWDMYEKRCAVIVADERAKAKALKSPEPAQSPTTILRSPSSPIIPIHPRRHSTDVAPKISLTLPGASKLTMRDFLIKPIQRICRYPLILGQLLAVSEDEDGRASLPDSGTTSVPQGQVDLIEVQALEAMKEVATKVDEARRRSDVAIKSRLVVERVSEQILPQLGSFGHCLLAGSLDVVYHHETIAPLTTPIKVKYLGAFLYGGWLLLVKVLKNKVYEPRYWFPLFDVNMTDIAEEDGLLPSSFRLSSGDHHFEFAAACLQEKVLWMNRIKVARTQAPLVSNPPSSLDEGASKPCTPTQISFLPPSRKNTGPTPLPVSGGVFPSMIPPPGDTFVTPPKRQSSLGVMDGTVMALENPGLASLITVEGIQDNWELPPSPTSSGVHFVPRTPMHSNTALDNSMVSMTPKQIKSLLEGETSTILIRRSSTNHRKMVDQSLQDVFFEECQAVRIAAQMKEPLFQPPKLTTDTGSTLSARNKMMKRDSVLLKRQKSVAESAASLSGHSPSTKSPSRFALSRNKSAGAVSSAKELRRRTLAIPSFSFFEEKEEDRAGRPRTADSTDLSKPTIDVTPDDASDAITFRTKRERGKRDSGQREELSGNPSPDQPSRPQTFHAPATEFAFLKELPPTPDVKMRRRNTFISPPSRSYDEQDARFSTLPTRPFTPRTHTDEYGQMPVQVYPIGQGLSNANPSLLGQGQGPKGKSRLHPESIFRRSLNLFGPKRTRSNPGGYFAGLFNRSVINVHDNDSNSALRTRSEPPPSPQGRLSASTPALKEVLSNWELIPNISLLKRSDTKSARPAPSQSSCSTDMQSPFNSHTFPATQPTPVPPLPRHTQTLQPAKSSLRRRSSQLIQHLNPLSQLSN